MLKKSPAEIAKQNVWPVTGTKSTVGSVWGDERDAGKRRHEGIDIFSARGTAVVAICDGYIQVLGNDDIGGKNITLQPYEYEWNAYYAHLDQQYVVAGQKVKKGQLIGTVGNTGNAKTTPPHLHFGIYTNNGAIDPLPYIKTSPRISAPVQADKMETKTTTTQKKLPTPVAKKSDTGKAIESAVLVLTGELLRRIKIRL